MTTADPSPAKVRSRPRKSFAARGRERWNALSGAQRRRLTGLLIFIAVLTLAFVSPLLSLMTYASGKELHSHILLVPFVSIYLLWINHRELPVDFKSSPGWGGALGAIGLALLGGGWYWQHSSAPPGINDEHLLPVLSYVFLLAAGGFLFLGSRWMRAAAFPVAFLVFLVPMPDAMAHSLETASQYASAEVASWFFGIAGIPFLREGTVFQLPGIMIQVAQECSGIRSSWVLFITSLIAAHMFLRSPWRKAIFVALVIPLGILRNGIRILVISWLCVEVSPDMIHHWIHHRGGPVFFALSLIPLFLLLWWFRRRESRSESRKNQGPGVSLAPGREGGGGGIDDQGARISHGS
ncbi:MAG TPA: exosortase/archaeosortase family protein [Verrucomicrobiales bacterium]|jgi:exosortase C (VPDSG-CTERM-specific)|nr:exosortase/archaeosortase family protein [Verrucomicrobiales bacterium]